MYHLTNYWDQQEIKLNVNQLTWTKQNALTEICREFNYHCDKWIMTLLKDTDFTSAIIELQKYKKIK